MRRIVQLSGLVLAALTATACVAGPGAANPTATPGATGTPRPTTGPTTAPSGSPVKPAIEHPTGKDVLVLRITLDGGFVPVNYHLTTLPVLSIYGDGRVIVQGAQIMIYPGPALPPLMVRTITEEGLQKVLAAAAEAGLLGADKQYSDGGMVADAATTTFILNAGGRIHTIGAYALYEADDMRGPNLSDEDFEARKRLKAFHDAVTNLPALVGASELTAEQPYTPHAFRIFVSDQAPVVDESNPEQDEIVWPLETPLGQFGEQIGTGEFALNCGVVEGADLDTLLPLLEKANTLTPWTSEKKSYTILVRPLLPDETGCPTI